MKKFAVPGIFVLILIMGTVNLRIVAQEKTQSNSEVTASVPATPASVPKDGKVTIRGRVTFPDGSPAKVSVSFQQGGMNGSYLNGISGSTNTDKDGYYEIPQNIPVNSVFAAAVQEPTNEKDPAHGYTSSVIAMESIDPLKPGMFDICLQKGIKIHGKLIHENGSPVSKRSVFFYAYPLGKEPIVMMYKDKGATQSMGVSIGFQAIADSSGKYSLTLLPGQQYTLTQSDCYDEKRCRDVVFTAEDTNCSIDVTIPNPSRGKVLTPGGWGARNVRIDYIAIQPGFSKGDRAVTGWRGLFSAYLSPYQNMVCAKTQDGKQGVITYPDGEDAKKPLTLTLQKPATARIRLLDKDTGEPIIKKRIIYAPCIRKEGNISYGEWEGTETDSAGYARLTQLYVGGDYDLDVQMPDENGERKNIKINPTKPGEVIDLGEKLVQGEVVKHETKEPKIAVRSNPEVARSTASLPAPELEKPTFAW